MAATAPVGPTLPGARPTPWTSLAAARDDRLGEADPWAPDPVLDGAMAANLATGPEVEATAQAAAALEESGFGSALHTALGELRRIADDPAPVHALAAGPASASESLATRSPGLSDPVWPSTEAVSLAERLGGTPAEWLASLGDWWTARWRELLPGMLVAGLVVVAFAVVLASGGRRSTTSHVDTRRPIASDPPTTIAGLFTTASVPPGEVPPPEAGSGAADGSRQAVAPATTTPSSDSSGPSPAAKSPPSTSTPVVSSPPTTQVSPPDTTTTTTPDTTTTTPHVTTTTRVTPPIADPGPTQSNIDICAIRRRC